MTLTAIAPVSSAHTRGLLIVGSGVILLSVDSLIIRLLAQSLPIIDVLFWRGIGSAIGFVLIAWGVPPHTVRVAFRSIGRAGLIVALLWAVGNVLFVFSVTHTTIAHALVIIAAAPMATAVLARVILHERTSRRTWVASLAVAGGIGLIFAAVPSQGDLIGDLAALLGALALSLNLVVLRRARLVSMVPAYAIGGILTALVSGPFVTRLSLSPREAGLAILVGVVVLPVSLSLVMRGPRYLQAPDVSLLLLLETVFAPVWAVLILGEVPDAPTLVGGGVIITALAAYSLVPGARTKAAQPNGIPVVASQADTTRRVLEREVRAEPHPRDGQ
jgi:drug/metabolite transporter (DMT)-like permease